ncbi:hypothetical protein PENFLA_c010G02870 [Penicillium flavigenum]|uniref:Uncharacterized protein n=1 Tax=Penicillium flavigenum TaxID=254877 RepID=A0A1V6TC37_9EURO|nr:hypothetical protein PENFLA_c010G02870 [Penicillium flavigenum]
MSSSNITQKGKIPMNLQGLNNRANELLSKRRPFDQKPSTTFTSESPILSLMVLADVDGSGN